MIRIPHVCGVLTSNMPHACFNKAFKLTEINTFISNLSIVMVNIAWDREEWEFIFVDPTDLFLLPTWKHIFTKNLSSVWLELLSINLRQLLQIHTYIIKHSKAISDININYISKCISKITFLCFNTVVIFYSLLIFS